MPTAENPELEDRRRALLRAAVAAELRAEVARADLTQDEVAARVGMHRATVNRLLNGSRSIDAEQLIAFALGLGFDAGDMVDTAKRKYLEQLARLNPEA